MRLSSSCLVAGILIFWWDSPLLCSRTLRRMCFFSHLLQAESGYQYYGYFVCIHFLLTPDDDSSSSGGVLWAGREMPWHIIIRSDPKIVILSPKATKSTIKSVKSTRTIQSTTSVTPHSQSKHTSIYPHFYWRRPRPRRRAAQSPLMSGVSTQPDSRDLDRPIWHGVKPC